MPYEEDLSEIVREILPDGTVRYLHSVVDGEVNIETKSLHDVFWRPFGRLQALADMLQDEDYERIGFLIEGIVEENAHQRQELFHFIKQAIGEIDIDIVGRDNVSYRTGRILGLRVTPPKPAGEASAME